MGGARLSGVHNCRRFLDRALAPEVMFPSPQRLKPAHFQILTAPLKRCSTLSTQGETALAGSTPPCYTTITKALQKTAVTAARTYPTPAVAYDPARATCVG